jgi:serine/threonine-protein kinase
MVAAGLLVPGAIALALWPRNPPHDAKAKVDPAPIAPAPVALPPSPQPPQVVVKQVAPTLKKGTLDVLVEPWAEVSVDGHAIGRTPILNLPLPTGPHSVRLENAALNTSRNYPVTITDGQRVVLREHLRSRANRNGLLGFPDR